MESVPGLLVKGLSYLLYIENNQDVLPALIKFALEGLDERKAMAQPESAYKVRHLKMGFKLAGALCSCDSNIAVLCLVRMSGHVLRVFKRSLRVEFANI